METDEVEGVDEVRAFETQVAEILAAEDAEYLAAAMLPGSVAGVLVWENRWAAPFASAARRSGGQLIATGRIPIQEMPHPSARVRRRRSRELTCRCVQHVQPVEA